MVLELTEGSCHIDIMLSRVAAVGDSEHDVVIQMDRTAYGDHDKSWTHVPDEEWILLIVICS
jgi:hypothetical protein